MKFLIAFLFCLPTVVFGQSDFYGTYDINSNNCVIGNEEFRRASVKLVGDTVVIRLFGDSAGIVSLETKSSKTLNPNFQFGNPVKYTITSAKHIPQKIIENIVTSEYASGRRENVEKRKLIRNGAFLVYEEEDLKRKTSFSCTMITR